MTSRMDQKGRWTLQKVSQGVVTKQSSKVVIRMLIAGRIKILYELCQDITLVKRFATVGSFDLECRHKP